eukprot:982215-Heterocapsa_arctica.AAC.1
MALASVQEMLDAMCMPGGEPPATIDGPVLGRNFTLRFRGLEELAAQRVRKFMASQRTDEGWRQMEADVPGGGRAKVFLDFDKNRKQVRGEILTKKMHKILKERMPNADLRVKRKEGTITLGWSPVVRITILSPDEQKI